MSRVENPQPPTAVGATTLGDTLASALLANGRASALGKLHDLRPTIANFQSITLQWWI